jgi:hypothetical protein
MKKEDAAYLAGIIDGEGCVSVLRSSTGGNRPSPNFTARIEVTMTSKEIIHWIKRVTKTGTIYPKPVFSRKHKKQWRWYANSHSAVSVIRKILPFLILKKRQAKNLLAFQNTAIRKSIRGACALSAFELARKNRYYVISRRLNKGRSGILEAQ